MENLKLLGGIIIVAVIVLLAILYVVQSPYGGPKSSFTISPSGFSAPACALPILIVNETLLSHAGFGYYNISALPDYVIAPGGTGVISFSMKLKKSVSSVNTTYSQLGVANQFEFFYNQSNTAGNYVGTEPLGSSTSWNIGNTTLALNQSPTIFNVTFTMSSNAPLGTYFVEFPPGICTGGQFALFTVGNVPYSGPLRFVLPP